MELETVYEIDFDEPIRMIHEGDLILDKTIAREPPEHVDWVLAGAGTSRRTRQVTVVAWSIPD